MIYFCVFNYSKLGDEEIESRISNFANYLKENGIERDFKIELCGESPKNRFQELIFDENVALIDNWFFELEVNRYLQEISKNINIQNYKAVFVGDLKTNNPWGEATDCLAVIKNLDEKAIWHELAHLFDVSDHYDEKTRKPLSICSDHGKCIMTYGNPDGELLCSASFQEIRKYMSECIKS